MAHLLWNSHGSLDTDLVARFESQHASCIYVPKQLTVAEPHPVGPALLLPVCLHIQVMQTIVVDLKWAVKVT